MGREGDQARERWLSSPRGPRSKVQGPRPVIYHIRTSQRWPWILPSHLARATHLAEANQPACNPTRLTGRCDSALRPGPKSRPRPSSRPLVLWIASSAVGFYDVRTGVEPMHVPDQAFSWQRAPRGFLLVRTGMSVPNGHVRSASL